MSKKIINGKRDGSINDANLNNIIHGSNTLLKLFCCLIIVVLICILIGQYAFKNGILTCDHYVFNTYLYIILAILIMFIVVLLNDQFGFFNSFIVMLMNSSLATLIIIFIILIILLLSLTYALKHVNPENILASNLIWTLLILLIGIVLIPTIWFGRLANVVGIAGILTIVITVAVGLLGYYYGDQIITFDWDYYLYIALWILIFIIIFGPIFITDPETMNTFILVVSFISLTIFVLLLLSNHKKLKLNSEKCIDGQVVPNYPLESYGIVIKIVNIFQDLINILGRTSGKRRVRIGRR